MTARILPFPSRPRAPRTLLDVDRELAAAEERLDAATQWIPRSRGASHARALAEVEEAREEVGRLKAERLRVAGAELALIRGGRD
jgi:hypothetical protein